MMHVLQVPSSMARLGYETEYDTNGLMDRKGLLFRRRITSIFQKYSNRFLFVTFYIKNKLGMTNIQKRK
jgi:hypothetical protein